MFKKITAPIQAWLLSQNRCVACGQPLSKGLGAEVRGQITVTCNCGRIFIFNQETKKYRRALFSEV